MTTITITTPYDRIADARKWNEQGFKADAAHMAVAALTDMGFDVLDIANAAAQQHMLAQRVELNGKDHAEGHDTSTSSLSSGAVGDGLAAPAGVE